MREGSEEVGKELIKGQAERKGSRMDRKHRGREGGEKGSEEYKCVRE